MAALKICGYKSILDFFSQRFIFFLLSFALSFITGGSDGIIAGAKASERPVNVSCPNLLNGRLDASDTRDSELNSTHRDFAESMAESIRTELLRRAQASKITFSKPIYIGPESDLVEFAFAFLSDPEQSAEALKSLYLKLLHQVQPDLRTFRGLLRAGDGQTALEALAQEELGHTPTEIFEFQSADQFRLNVLVPGRPFWDCEFRDTPHTMSAHLLQWLILAPALERQFGSGAFQRLLGVLSQPEASDLWQEMFDVNSSQARDLRNPATFFYLSLAGQSYSYFGVY